MRSYVFVLHCVLAIAVGFSSASAQDTNLLAAAKREGRVVWYSSVGESQQFAQEFEKKFPFIKVDVVRGTVYPLMNRILNEAAAGNYLFDVVRQATLTIGLLFRLRSSSRVSQIAKSACGLGLDNESDRHYRRSAGASGQRAQPERR